MSSNSKVWTAAIAAGLCGAILGAGVVWFSQQGAVAQLNVRIIKADADTQAALQKMDELQTSLTAAQETASATAAAPGTTPASPAAPTPTPTTPKKTSKSVKQFTYITKVNTSGKVPIVTADYAQMLNGTAAAAAATAHGDESPPPNDYYIVNDNTTLRKLTVQPGISVTVTTNDDGTADPTGHTIPFAKWAAYYAAPDTTNESLRQSPYWITVKNNIVTAIAEQYLP